MPAEQLNKECSYIQLHQLPKSLPFFSLFYKLNVKYVSKPNILRGWKNENELLCPLADELKTW